MKARFTHALRYFVRVTCVSPFRTGGTGRDLQEVLRYADGTPFLQGTSLAGALNGWRPDPHLFGDRERESSLIVSDLIFDTLETDVRPRLSIDGATGTAAHGAKFDIAALPTGTKGSFQLTWTGNADPKGAAQTIETYLRALHSGAIALGAQKSNGYGQVALTVQKRAYCLTDPEDRQAWLAGDRVTDLEPLPLEAFDGDQVVFLVTAHVDSLLVKAAAGDGTGETGVKAVQMSDGDRLIVPGSSIKGVLRAQIQRLLPHLPEEVAAVPARFLGRMAMGEDNGIAGKARFSDAILTNVKKTVTPRIRLDRFTGGVMDRFLFSEECVAGDLSFQIRAPKDCPAGLGLLLFALRDLGLGLCELGSGTNIGRGRVLDLQVQIRTGEQTAGLCCPDGTVTVTDPDGLIAQWTAAITKGGCR